MSLAAFVALAILTAIFSALCVANNRPANSFYFRGSGVGAKHLVDEVDRLIRIKPGETSEDMKFSLETVNCVGACAMPPVFIVDETYHGKAKIFRLARILKRVAAGGQDSAD